MTTSRRFRRAPRRGSRNPTRWMSAASSPTTIAAGVQGFFDMTDVDLIPSGWDAGFTVIRMIGRVQIRNATFDVDTFGAFGIGVVSRDAEIAGALPEPNGDLYQWYLQRAWLQRQPDHGFTDYAFDIRSARKIPSQNHTLVAVMDNAGGSASSITWALDARLLVRRS